MSRSPKPATTPASSPLHGADPVDESPRPVPRLLYRMKDLEEALNVSGRTIERERSAGRFPPPDLKIGKVPLWKTETIRGWVDGGGG